MGRLPLPRQARLLDVSAADARTAFVVGVVAHGDSAQPIALRWDGTRWEEIDAGLPSEGIRGLLDEVAAVSGQEAWALTLEGPVGDSTKPQPMIRRLYRWRGSSWQLVRTIHADLPYAGLHVLSASQDGQVWLGGAGLSEHWDGRSWRSEPAPSRCRCGISHIATQPGAGTWALTDRTEAGGIVSGDVLHWEGREWRIIPAPSGIRLDGIAPVPPAGAWVIGGRCPAPTTIHSGEVVCPGPEEHLAVRTDGGPWGRMELLPATVGGPARLTANSRSQVWLYPAQAKPVYYDGRRWSLATGTQDPAGTCAVAEPWRSPPIASVPGTSAFLVVGTAKDGSGPCVARSGP